MPDLEKQIAEWRRQMAAAGIKSPVPLEELETHLREDVEQRVRSGLNEQRAFEAAVQQIGKATMLKNEFEKADGTSEAQKWKRKEILLAACVGLDSLIIGAFPLFNPEFSFGQRMSGLAAVATMIVLTCLGFLGHRFFPAILNQRVRESICLSASAAFLLWLAVFAYLILPRVDFTMNKMALTVIWSMTAPVGVLAGLIVGLNKAAWKKTALAGS